jgi:hypothetical protein
MSQNRARNGAFWYGLKIKITSRRQAANEAIQIIDNSSRAEINPQSWESRKSGRNWLLLASG